MEEEEEAEDQTAQLLEETDGVVEGFVVGATELLVDQTFQDEGAGVVVLLETGATGVLLLQTCHC